MHFRERNRVVQVIRTTYDRRTQKGKPEIVARLNKARPAITDEVRKACSADELREIEAWIAANGAMTPAVVDRRAQAKALRVAMAADQRGQAKKRRAAMIAAAQIGLDPIRHEKPAAPAKSRPTPAVLAPAARWKDPKAGAEQLMQELEQAGVWFRRNRPTEENKALAAGLALRMHRVRTMLRKKGWIAQNAAAGKT